MSDKNCPKCRGPLEADYQLCDRCRAPFVETAHCIPGGGHCHTCRNLEGGRAWRTSLSKVFTLPLNLVDFACPKGLTWQWAKPKSDAFIPAKAKCSVVISAFNEGNDLEATIATLWASTSSILNRMQCRKVDEVIVVDDGSIVDMVDESRFPAAWLDDGWLKIIKLGERTGVGPARAIGISKAIGDYIIVTDAHMRFPCDFRDQVEMVVREYPDSCLTFRSTGIESGSHFDGFGAALRVNVKHGGFDPVWNVWGAGDYRLANVHEVMAPLGACYVFPRYLLSAIGGFCDLFVGWGGDEEDLACRIWLSGFRVMCVPSIVVAHNYTRWQKAVPFNEWHVDFNRWIWHYMVFENATWKEDFEPAMVRFLSDKGLMSIVDRELDKRSAKIEERRQMIRAARKHPDEWFFRAWNMEPWISRPSRKPCRGCKQRA